MACRPEILKAVPLFSTLDEEETAVLAGQVEIKTFVPRQRIYKMGDAGGRAYVMVSGRVRVTTVDEDHQELIVDEPRRANSSGLPRCSIRLRIKPTPSQWKKRFVLRSIADDIAVLLERKPHGGYGYAHRARTASSMRRNTS